MSATVLAAAMVAPTTTHATIVVVRVGRAGSRSPPRKVTASRRRRSRGRAMPANARAISIRIVVVSQVPPEPAATPAAARTRAEIQKTAREMRSRPGPKSHPRPSTRPNGRTVWVMKGLLPGRGTLHTRDGRDVVRRDRVLPRGLAGEAGRLGVRGLHEHRPRGAGHVEHRFGAGTVAAAVGQPRASFRVSPSSRRSAISAACTGIGVAPSARGGGRGRGGRPRGRPATATAVGASSRP